jgi:hypothetical protein
MGGALAEATPKIAKIVVPVWRWHIRLKPGVLPSSCRPASPNPMKITVLLHRRLRRSVLRFLCLGAGVFLSVWLSPTARAQNEAPRKIAFDIPGADAIVSLQVFAQQSGQEIIYSPDIVRGTRTNEVKGEFTPTEAIKQMLAGTALAHGQTSHGLIAISRIDDPKAQGTAQSNAAPENEGSAGGSPAPVPTPDQVSVSGTTTTSEGVTKLPPFEVESSSHDIGYYTQNTTMGTRLNTNLSDLASSITVISKQQMTDTSSVNINDLFLYEASTEGTENWTDVGGAAKGTGYGDQISQTPQEANRIRGLGAANVTRDYFISNPLMILDTYNLNDVEISRGPNSTLFGIGTASGIVNQSVETAVLNKDSNEVSIREGSFGDFRATMNFNRVLIPDKLAIAVAGLYANEHDTAQEPAYNIQRREFATVTLKPFSSTTIRANVEYYDNPERMPNSITPADEVTPWLANGSPKWDPITYTATVNGVTSAPITNNALMPAGLYTASLGNYGLSPTTYLVNGVPQLWEQQELGTNFVSPGSPTTPSGTLGPIGYERNAMSHGNYLKFASSAPAGQVTYPLFREPGVSNPSLLNYQGINMLSDNIVHDTAVTYHVEVEQQILDNLFLEAGYYNETFQNLQRNYQGADAGNAIVIDPNTRLLNGTPNPFFGDVYTPVNETGDNYYTEPTTEERLSLVYQLDFTKNNNWTKWFGHHTLQAYYGHMDKLTTTYGTYENVLDAHSWWSTTDIGNNDSFALKDQNLYLSSNGNSTVQFSPGEFLNHNFTYPLTWYNTQLNGGTWTNENVKIGPVYAADDVEKDEQQVWSYSGSLQSYLLDDRLVVTLGQRHDYERARASFDQYALPVDPTTGLTDTSYLSQWSNWTYADGITRQAGAVAHLTKWLSVHYNQSDNFTVTSLGEDAFGNVLPSPTGTGKDYGFTVSLFDDKLVAELNWYKTNQANAHTSASFAGRAYTIDYSWFVYWAQEIATNNLGASASGTAINNYAQNIVKFPTGLQGMWTAEPYYSDTETITSNGWEFNLIYNPQRNWTMKLTADEDNAVDTAVYPGIQKYLASRLPVWTTASDPVLGPFWTTISAGNVGAGAVQGTSPQQYLSSSVDAAGLDEQLALQGQRQPDISRYHFNYLTNYQFVTGKLTGFGLGTALRYETPAAIGYLGGPPDPAALGAIDSLNITSSGLIYGKEVLHQDMWISYKQRLPWLDRRIRGTLQLNCRDVWSNGYLLTVAINPDGSPLVYRIIPPRQWYLQETFDF